MERRSFFKLAGCSIAAVAAAGALSACGETNTSETAETEDDTPQETVVNQPEVSFSTEVDVLIVGSGIAGLSAAMAPVEAGRSVLITEKLELLGGESYNANGIMYIAGSALQRDAGISLTAEEAWESLEEELIEEGFETLDLAKTIFLAAPNWVDHLIDTYDAEFADPAEYIEQGVNETILLPKNGLGDMESIMMPLRDQLAENGATLQADYRAIDCIVDESGEICGMRFMAGESGPLIDVRARRIVVATGGFASSPSFMDEYLPAQEHIGCYTTASVGEGLTLCADVGAQLANMEIEPPLTSDIPEATTWGLFGPSLIVDALGRRFAREDRTSAAPNTCFTEERGFWWIILDEQLTDGIQARSLASVTTTYTTRFVGPCDDIETLAEEMGVPSDTLNETFENYAECVKAGEDEEFGRTEFLQELTAPYYAVKQFPVRYKTYGGVSTDETGQVLNATGIPIANLYCCGAAVADNMVGLASAGPFGMLVGQAVVASLDEEDAAGEAESPEA